MSISTALDRKGENGFSTLSNRIYHQLRDQILRGTIPSGSRLVRRKISKQFGVSPIPVTEAIFRLEQDGLVESEPMFGARVRVITAEDLRNEQALREAIEGYAARLYAERATRAQLDALARQAEELDAFLLSNNQRIDQATKLHTDFHLTIARQTGFPLIEKELQRLWFRQLMLINTVNNYLHPQPATWHQDLVKVLMKGDSDEAEKKMREHLRWGLEHKVEALKQAEKLQLLEENQ